MNKNGLWIFYTALAFLLGIGFGTGITFALSQNEVAKVEQQLSDKQAELEAANEKYDELVESHELTKKNLEMFQRSGITESIDGMTGLLGAATELSATLPDFDPQELMDLHAQVEAQLNQ